MRKQSETVMPAALRAQSEYYRALFFDIAQSFPGSCEGKSTEHVLSFVLRSCPYFHERLAHEGESFLLTTLPKLGKAVETSLITMEPLQVPMGWALAPRSRLPVFCNELFKRLFTDDGLPRHNWETSVAHSKSDDIWRFDWVKTPGRFNELWAAKALIALRQICMAYSKVDKPCSNSVRVEALKAFKQRMTAGVQLKGWTAELSIAKRLISFVLESDLPEARLLRSFQKEGWGRHGPGAVAGREVGPRKWDLNKIPGLSDEIFRGFGGRMLPLGTASARPGARVAVVPKDFRGPRIICIEPKEFQFAQQGIMEVLYKLLQRHRITRGAISFFDVSESRRLCEDPNFATIDLKDASDMLSLQLARIIFPKWFFRLVTACRSSEIDVDGEVVRTKALATMGNATCFPLETMVFWAMSMAAQIAVRDSFYRRVERLASLPRCFCRVFGDDIIVPVALADSVQDCLSGVGLVVNASKTCGMSLVRESCGEWRFHGHDVGIQKYRSTSVKDYRSWIQYCDYYLSLKERSTGLLANGAVLEWIRSQLHAFLPPEKLRRRYNRKLQRTEVRIPQFVTVGAQEELLGDVGLYAHAVKNDLTPFLKGARKLVKMRWVRACDLNWYSAN